MKAKQSFRGRERAGIYGMRLQFMRHPLGWKTRLALGLLSVAALMLPSLAYSCDCEEPPFNPESDVGHAGAVFLGTVTAITSRPVNSQEESLLTDAVTFEASEAWKAIASKEVIVRGIGSDCDFPFEVGNEYLVFAQRNDSTGDWVVAQ